MQRRYAFFFISKTRNQDLPPANDQTNDHPDQGECDDKAEEREQTKIEHPKRRHDDAANSKGVGDDPEDQKQEEIQRKRSEASLNILRAQRDVKRHGKDHQKPQNTSQGVGFEGVGKIQEEGEDVSRQILEGMIAKRQMSGACQVVVPLIGEAEPKHQHHHQHAAEDGPQTDEEIAQSRPEILAVVAMIDVAVNAVLGLGCPQTHALDLVSKERAHHGMPQFMDGGSDHRGDIKDGSRRSSH